MLSGRLKHRITIEKLTRVQGPLGPEEKWVPVETRWGRVALVKLEGRALYQEVGHSEVSHRVTLRGHVELTLAAHRLRWEGRNLLLKPLEPPAYTGDRQPFTTIVCKEYDNAPEPSAVTSFSAPGNAQTVNTLPGFKAGSGPLG